MAKVTDQCPEFYEQVAKEMKQYEKVFADSQFTKRVIFMEKYAGWGGLHAWQDEYKQGISSGGYVSGNAAFNGLPPLDFERAKPFIRAVVERMLDLLDSEESWIKHAVAQNEAGDTVGADEAGAKAWCLIGAKAKALADLQLSNIQSDRDVEKQRHRVLKAVEQFMQQRMQDEHGHSSLPSWNDSSETTFEDVRLWLKSCLTHLED